MHEIDYPELQQFRIWSPEEKKFCYSGGTPMMLANFFEHTARLHTVHKMPYQRDTGSHDKNGNPIYEGSIVTCGERLGVGRLVLILMILNISTHWQSIASLFIGILVLFSYYYLHIKNKRFILPWIARNILRNANMIPSAESIFNAVSGFFFLFGIILIVMTVYYLANG